MVESNISTTTLLQMAHSNVDLPVGLRGEGMGARHDRTDNAARTRVHCQRDAPTRVHRQCSASTRSNHQRGTHAHTRALHREGGRVEMLAGCGGNTPAGPAVWTAAVAPSKTVQSMPPPRVHRRLFPQPLTPPRPGVGVGRRLGVVRGNGTQLGRGATGRGAWGLACWGWERMDGERRRGA